MGVIEFQIPSGETVKISACDAHLVLGRRWYRSVGSHRLRYVYSYCSGSKGRRDYLHRLILGFPARPAHVDHINGDGLDNRRENLRVVTSSQNLHNSQLSVRNKVGLKGVKGPFANKGVYKKHGTYATQVWQSHICVDWHVAYLGSFYTPIEAGIAYDIAALAFLGDHALTNLSLGLLPEELKEEILSKVVGIKLPDHEYKRWVEQADKERLTVPKWVRKQIAVAARSVALPESVRTKAVRCTDAVVDVVPPPFSLDWAEWDGSQLIVGFTENFESSTTAFKPVGKKPLDSLIVQVNEWGLAHGVTTDASALVRNALKERGE